MAAKRKHLEDAEQKGYFKWAWMQPHPWLPGSIGDYAFAVPNGAHLANPSHARKMKEMGMKPGVHDICLPNKAGGYAGLWIEMKKRPEHFSYPSEMKRALSEDQRDWGRKMEMCGYKWVVAYGWDEAMDYTLEYLKHGG